MKRLFVFAMVLILASALFAGGVIGTGKPISSPKVQKSFPFDIAGFGCWVKLNEAPNFNNVAKVIQQMVQISDSHILGWTSNSGPQKIKVHIYADISGYLVTFLSKDLPPSNIIDWSYVNFYDETVSFFTITKVLQDLLLVLGYSEDETYEIMKGLNYCDFAYPNAQEFVVALVATKPKQDFTKDNVEEEYLHIALKKSAKIYNWSMIFGGVYPHYIYVNNNYNHVYNSLYIDGKVIFNRNDLSKQNYRKSWTIWEDSAVMIKGLTFDPNEPHTFKISTSANLVKFSSPGMAKLGVVVIYGE